MEKQNSGFMNKFQAVLEKYVVPVAMKISQQRHLAAVRDGIYMIFFFIPASPLNNCKGFHNGT